MKTLLNTTIALLLVFTVMAQNYENTFFYYSEGIKSRYEKLYEIQPYQNALTGYFSDLHNHFATGAEKEIPEIYFHLAQVEFKLIQGRFQQVILNIDSLFNHNPAMSIQYPDDYLLCLLFKSLAYQKTDRPGLAWQTLIDAEAFAKLNTSNRSLNKIRNLKANLLIKSDHYNEVDSLLHPILNHIEGLNKEMSLDYVNALLLKSELYIKQNREDSAFTLLKKSIDLLQQFYRDGHMRFIMPYIYLGACYRNTGQYAEAENYYTRALQIFEIKIGGSHPDLAFINNMLANLYRRSGKLEFSNTHYNASLKILRTLGYDTCTQFALTLTNQGLLYTLTGKRKEAEQNYALARQIMINNKDTLDLDYVTVLENQANLSYNQSKFDEAEQLYQYTLQVRKKLQGEHHEDFAQCLNNLGNTYKQKGNYALAESYYLQSIDALSGKGCREQLINPNFYNNLALLYSQTNQLEKALKIFLEVKVIYEKRLGKFNRTYLTLLDNLGETYVKLNDDASATQYLIEASKLRKRIIYDSFRYLSASEVENFLQRFRRGIANFNNYLLQRDHPADSLLIEAYENEIFYKSFLLNYHLEMNKILEANPGFSKLTDSIKTIYQDLYKEYARSPLNNDRIDSLESATNQLEMQLGQLTESYKKLIHQTGFNEIRKLLKPGEAVLEMMYLNLNPLSGKDSTFYAAMLVFPDKPQPVMLPLCSESALSQLFVKTHTLNSDYVNTLYGLRLRGAIALQNKSGDLYTLVWKNIETHLRGIKTIYYIPAGLLHKINIQAIPINNHEVAGQLYDIIQLTSCQQLQNLSKSTKPLRTALLMGGIQYDEIKSTSSKPEMLEARIRSAVSKTINGISAYYWPELTYSFRETYQINLLLKQNKIQVKKYSGVDASEEQFKALAKNSKSPAILHFATHGYFFPETIATPDPKAENKICSYMNSRNPMMRSGLILAYGNYAWQNCEPLPGRKEDGILTAYEISQMNLSQTQLAVLSACETGLGDIRGTEGVYGMQRAFKIAGVKNLIMSLWQIPDTQTEELMLHFYKNLMKQHMNISKAFKKAQMEMKNKYEDPYFWAGFVLVQ